MTDRGPIRRAFQWEGRERHVARDVDAELEAHFALCVEDLVRRGMTLEAARAEARRRFGDVDGTRRRIAELDVDCVRRERRADRWDGVRQDVRYALRALRRQPAFTLVVVLTLALGIGANATIFSVLDGVLLRPLPYPAPERLVTLWTDNRVQGWPRDVSSYPNFADWKASSATLADLAAYRYASVTLTGVGQPERVVAIRATPSLFGVLGVAAARGRTLLPEDQEREQRVVVLSDGYWRRRFGADPGVVGRAIRLSGVAHEVVGVMPPGFAYPDADVEAWLPFEPDIAETPRGQFWLDVVGRLKPGVPLERARADLASVARRLEAQYPEANTGLGVTIVPLHELVVGDVRRALLVLMGAVGFVLLIACANVANLVLVRAASRTREFAVRAALGAGGRRIAQQLVVESVCLALLGGALGLLAAVGGVWALARLGPASVPRLDAVRVDGTVLLFTLGVSLFTAVLFGLPYGLRAAAVDLGATLKDGLRGSGVRGLRARRLLVVSQLALALVLLVSASLLLSSFRRLQTLDAGFDPEGVLTASLALPTTRYDEPAKARAFYETLLERVRALPGVEGAAMTSILPLSGNDAGGPIAVEGRPPTPGLDDKEVRFTRASDGYFAAMRTPLRRGREFLASDVGSDSAGVAVVNETLARTYFAGADPIGRRVKFGSRDAPGPWLTVVGVVPDAKQRLLDAPVRPELFVPLARFPGPSANLVVRGATPAALADPLRRAVAALDADLALAGVQPLTELRAASLATRRFNALLLALFSAVALALAVVGIYGVMSYAVAARKTEVGIRLAIGAQPAQVVRLVLRDAVAMTAVGLALGVALAMAATRLLRSLLFDVSATDPALFAGTALVLGLTAVLAGWLPARRAAGVDPLVAMRTE